MLVVATGLTDDGDAWALRVGSQPAESVVSPGRWPGPFISLTVTTISGRRLSGGAGDWDLGGLPCARWFGADEAGPRMGIVVVREDVAKAEAVLSNRARLTIQLHGTPALGRARVGALVFSRGLDLHRLDLFDGAGVSLDAYPYP